MDASLMKTDLKSLYQDLTSENLLDIYVWAQAKYHNIFLFLPWCSLFRKSYPT